MPSPLSSSIRALEPPQKQTVHAHKPFFGPWVVRATFIMAMLGWGIGFYGPAIYLHAVVQRTGWPLALVSSAVTVHYVVGALVILRLPAAHRRFGIGPTAVVGAACTTLGVIGWSAAATPWQLFASTLLSGGGWVTMGAVAVNAAIAPWYVRDRPMALAKAYNGASVGGVVFSPLWVWSIGHWGFTAAAAGIGLTITVAMVVLAQAVYTWTPERLGQHPDGEAPCVKAAPLTASVWHAPINRPAWRDRRLWTLALGMAAGLFAQIGVLAHLFTMLVPVLGAQAAGTAMGFATACAIGGRLIVARLMPSGTDRRTVAALGYAVQLAGVLILFRVDGQQTALIILAVALFGSGIGNATSLPPLIAQAEFGKDDVAWVVARIVAISQATYAFAPAAFGLLLGASAAAGAGIGAVTWPFFAAVAAVQAIAISCFLAGRRHTRTR